MAPPRTPKPRPARSQGLLLDPGFVTPDEREAALRWLEGLHPLWEMRFSTLRPPPAGEEQRPLLRPVYWLGSWQFACLGYYTPPRGTVDRCVEAEPFPEPLASWARRAEERVHKVFPAELVPQGWMLNTALLNFYGDRIEPDGRRQDRARVGDHRDHEPGPVVSISLGERALFQFTTRRGEVVRQDWLEDGMLQAFSGPDWKRGVFHRVQRVERKRSEALPPALPGFETRRMNITFRFVPPGAVVPYGRLGAQAQADVRAYVEELARFSDFWARALAESGRA